MILHIFLTDSIYTKEFIRFVLKRFKSEDHVFCTPKPSYYEDISGAEIRRINPKRLDDVVRLFKYMKFSKRILLHSLFNFYFQAWLTIQPSLLQRATWVAWGADVYSEDPYKGLKGRIRRHVRKVVVKNLGSIAGLFKGDYEHIVKCYRTKAPYRQVFYPNPVHFEILDEVIRLSESAVKNRKRIMVGHAASRNNFHEEMLLFLRDNIIDDYEIICPLSYGDKNYAQSVIQLGNSLFGTRFIPVTDFLQPKEYAKLLNSIDVVIFNHRYQEAVGNMLAVLYLGKKLYIRGETTPWSFFKDLGVVVYDTNALLKGDYRNFWEMDEKDKLSNRAILIKEFSEERCAELWEKVFNGDQLGR